MPFEKGNELWRKATHNKHKPTFIRHHTQEERLKISEGVRLWHQRNEHPLKGKHHSPETKLKMSLSRRGSSNANWRGGLTEIVRGIRRSPEYYQWRKAVLERDNQTCQDCGATKDLDAHHIFSIIDYPEMIFVPDAGLTLCRDCHKRHTIWQKLKKGRRLNRR